MIAWIESHQELLNHPKVYDLMRLAGWTKAETIGRLHMLWWWCGKYAEDGDLSRYNDDRIAAAMGIQADEAAKIVITLIETCWIDRDPYLRIHDWWDYAEKSLRFKYRNKPEKWRKIRDLYVTSLKKPLTNHIVNYMDPHIVNYMVPNEEPRKATTSISKNTDPLKKKIKIKIKKIRKNAERVFDDDDAKPVLNSEIGKPEATEDWSDMPEIEAFLSDPHAPLPRFRAQLHDHDWWVDVEDGLGRRIEPDFLCRQFAKISAWVTEHPKRAPRNKPGPLKNFIRNWLDRAIEIERRDARFAQKKRT